MNVGAFIIHLARATARAPQVDRLRTKLPIAVTVLDAVDGETLTDDQIRSVYQPRIHKPRYPFRLTAAEIACFMSHRKAWQAILDSGLDAALVLEDDVEIDEMLFPEVLAFAATYARPDLIVRFPRKARGEAGKVRRLSNGQARIVAPRYVRLGMQAVLVGCEAAETLLSFTRLFDRPVDTTIQLRWLHGVPIVSAMPVAIREIAAHLGGTTVQLKGTSAGTLRATLLRDFRRARYRLAVRLRGIARRSPS